MKNTNSNDTPKTKKEPIKFSLANTLLIALTSTLVGVFLTFSAVLVQRNNTRNSELAEVDRVYKQLKETYYKNVSDEKLKNGAISGMLSALDDPYSLYLNNDQAAQINQTIEGNNFGGIGVQVTKKNNQVVIDSLLPGTPAQKANLKTGDIVKAVDGKQLKNGDITAASSLIRGEVGTTVTLTIVRNNQEIKVPVKRAKITQSTVSQDKINATTSIVTITQFDANTSKDLKKVLKQLEREKVTKVILDVRGNPGGVMSGALEAASYFVPDGKVLMQYQQKNKKPVKYKSEEELNDGYHTKLKPVILIDGNSASAAEIFAAALNQSANVPLIGQKSFGKGTVQEVNTLNKKSEYKYTVAKWLTPDGTWINKKGLTPTRAVPVAEYLKTSGFTTQQTMKQGMTGLDIVTLQQMLGTLGFLNNHVTGVYDVQTVNAVKAFQTKYKLAVTGVFTVDNQSVIYTALVDKAVAEDQTLKIAEKELNK